MKSMELQCWKTLFDLKKNILSIQEELSKLKLMYISFSYTFLAIIKLYDFSESWLFWRFLQTFTFILVFIYLQILFDI